MNPNQIQKDLVCGMEVTPNSAAAELEYKGKNYYFCSLACKKAFEANPERYIEKGDEQ
ncbi:MAG: YHS domain-containing protein [Anaerolineales bacterium]